MVDRRENMSYDVHYLRWLFNTGLDPEKHSC